MENLTQKEIILAVLLIVYLVVGFKTPEPIANLVDTIVGKVVIMLMVVYLFVHHNPILAVLALYYVVYLRRKITNTLIWLRIIIIIPHIHWSRRW